MISTVDSECATDMLVPCGLLERARCLPLPAFLVRPEARRILLVRVRRERELLEQLRRRFGVAAQPVPEPKVLDLQTAISGMTDFQSGAHTFGRSELLDWIGLSACFAVPLMPRSADAEGRVTLGRSRSADLSLRTRCVSREHAQFVLAERGKFDVVDQESRNGTFHNGQRLEPGERTPVRRGDALRFGEVETLCCPPDLFWSVAQSE